MVTIRMPIEILADGTKITHSELHEAETREIDKLPDKLPDKEIVDHTEGGTNISPSIQEEEQNIYVLKSEIGKRKNPKNTSFKNRGGHEKTIYTKGYTRRKYD